MPLTKPRSCISVNLNNRFTCLIIHLTNSFDYATFIYSPLFFSVPIQSFIFSALFQSSSDLLLSFNIEPISYPYKNEIGLAFLHQAKLNNSTFFKSVDANTCKPTHLQDSQRLKTNHFT